MMTIGALTEILYQTASTIDRPQLVALDRDNRTLVFRAINGGGFELSPRETLRSCRDIARAMLAMRQGPDT